MQVLICALPSAVLLIGLLLDNGLSPFPSILLYVGPEPMAPVSYMSCLFTVSCYAFSVCVVVPLLLP